MSKIGVIITGVKPSDLTLTEVEGGTEILQAETLPGNPVASPSITGLFPELGVAGTERIKLVSQKVPIPHGENLFYEIDFSEKEGDEFTIHMGSPSSTPIFAYTAGIGLRIYPEGTPEDERGPFLPRYDVRNAKQFLVRTTDNKADWRVEGPRSGRLPTDGKTPLILEIRAHRWAASCNFTYIGKQYG